MNLLIFGTGRFWENRRKYLNEHSIAGFIDNDCRKWGEIIEGIVIQNPNQALLLDYDKILLMSVHSGEMKRQLLQQLGIKEDKIMLWEEFEGLADKGHLELYCANTYGHFNKKDKVLVIAQYLDYSGGPLTAVYAAMALYERGYQVCLAAPGGKKDFIHEVNDVGIDVILYKNICYASWEELKWIEPFHFVIVNTLLMMHCALIINKKKPLFWWVHEVNEIYEIVNNTDPYRLKWDASDIRSFAVSNVAKKNFEKYLTSNYLKILPYGIPDRKLVATMDHIGGPMVIAVIGPVSVRKGQDIFVNAIKQLDPTLCINTEFWIIGDLLEETPFVKRVLKESAPISNIIFKGRMTRKEIALAYDEIDVVVCSSREETMSMTITEGMMFGKVCVTSDSTGIADFMNNGENGFVFETENYIDLSRKLSDIINDRCDLERIRENARKTYLENFSMEKFGERLEQILEEM